MARHQYTLLPAPANFFSSPSCPLTPTHWEKALVLRCRGVGASVIQAPRQARLLRRWVIGDETASMRALLLANPAPGDSLRVRYHISDCLSETTTHHRSALHSLLSLSFQ